MPVTSFDIHSRRPYFEGRSFGDGGVYERIDGVVHFAVDPANAANKEIADLDRATRDPAGLVTFEADFCILQPLDPAGANGRLLFDVSNRGGKPAMALFNSFPPPLEPTDDFAAGNGFLMRHGWTVAWCGWQWDVPRGAVGMIGIDVPMAIEDGRPIPGQVCVEVVRNTPAASVRLCDELGLVPFRTYPAADIGEPGARMTVQEWADGPRSEVPRDRWRFARDEAGRPVADDECAWLAGGFEPGKVYDIFYRTRISPVVGAGLLAVRDFTSALRHGDPGSPCTAPIGRAYGFGISQSGRFLRTLLYHGLNVDEQGRQVFDGLIPHVAGGRRGEFNHRHAQPSVEVTPGFGHLPPWADDGEGGGLLDNLRRTGTVPKILYTNSSAEYWRGDASLVHTSPDGREDLALPPEVRAYLFAGAQHGPGIWPLLSRIPIPNGAVAGHWINAIDYRPLLRAALVTLDRWVSEGVEPPPTAVPCVAAGTAISRKQALEKNAAIPGVSLPDPGKLRSIQELDLGPRQAERLGRWPAIAGATMAANVPAVDSDGNEMPGIRLPDVAVPVATYTAWNPRHPSIGGEGQVVRYMGSTFPFASNPAERQATGDPRPSIAERYAGRQDYEARVAATAKALVASRHLLAEDIDTTVKAALAKHDAFVAGVPVRPG
ncbi:MAG: alpha/beta hydrolase domain-containing protein [Dehalococcoidia bacterium]